MASAAQPSHGLSRDVTLAVLPRLYIKELVAELTRRNISFGGYSFEQDVLVGMLKNVMTQEYRSLEPEQYPPDEFTNDAGLAERDQNSQTLSRICPSPYIERRPSIDSGIHHEKDTAANQERNIKLEAMCLAASPDASASCTSSVLLETATEGNAEIRSAWEGKETVTSATNRPGWPLDNVCSPTTEIEDDQSHSNAGLYCIDSVPQSSANENNTCQKPSDIIVYSFNDCADGTDQRSDFVTHTGAQNSSFVLGIKREEDENTPQANLIETEQEMETPEVTFMVNPSRTVITDEHMQPGLHMTEPVPENSGLVIANCNDVKAALCIDANGERCSYETERDGNKSHSEDVSESHGFGNERASNSEKDSSTCLEPQDIPLYVCQECDYQTKYRSHLAKHTRIHTGEKPFMCKYCDYKATQNTSLKRHMLRHSGMKPYKCRDCDFKTTDKGNLVKHMRKHTGEKPYMCGECGFRTAHKHTMDHHMKRHTGEKPHVCNICGYRAIQKVQLLVHQRKHTGEKPFVCGDCGYKSAYKRALAVHMKRHTTDVKPLSCDQCGFMTTSNSTLVTHNHVRHVDKPCGDIGNEEGKVVPD